MTKFYGYVGYAEQVVIRPGVHEDIIVERKYYGDVDRDVAKWRARAESVHSDISVANVVSIVADAYAEQHIFAIRYVEWAGARWAVADVEVARPRLKLRLGGLYNGPLPA